jgi:hypothetical protein
MEVDVIDDPDKSVNQQANGRCKKPVLKRGQEGMNVHVHVSTGCLLGSRIYMGYLRRFRKAKSIRHLIYPAVVAIIVKQDLQVSYFFLRGSGRNLMPRGRDKYK